MRNRTPEQQAFAHHVNGCPACRVGEDPCGDGRAMLVQAEAQAAVNRYLDALRASGVVNMFGAAPYVAEAFGTSKQEARAALAEWMRTFEARQAAGEVKR